jgi:hypothetical protein
MNDERQVYPEHLHVLVAEGTKARLDAVARGMGCTMSELVRRHLALAVEQKATVPQLVREEIIKLFMIPPTAEAISASATPDAPKPAPRSPAPSLQDFIEAAARRLGQRR